MKEYMSEEQLIVAAGKLLVRAVRLRKQIGAMATWCEADEVGRYSLNDLINNLAAISIDDGHQRSIVKLLR